MDRTMDVARMKARSVLEQMRIMAMYSGNFYKEIMPAMYDASIINQERFIALMGSREIETQISTRELLDLAVAWNVTPSASDFWKIHKSRDDLVTALRRRKEELEKQALEQEQAPLVMAAGAASGSGGPLSGPGSAGSSRGGPRRSSLSGLSTMFAGKESMGDMFGTKGEYTDGIIYMARRVRMDAESMEQSRQRLKQASALVRAARAHRRRGAGDGSGAGGRGLSMDEDDNDAWLSTLDGEGGAGGAGGEGMPGSPSSPTVGGSSPAAAGEAPDTFALNGGAAGGAASSAPPSNSVSATNSKLSVSETMAGGAGGGDSMSPKMSMKMSTLSMLQSKVLGEEAVHAGRVAMEDVVGEATLVEVDEEADEDDGEDDDDAVMAALGPQGIAALPVDTPIMVGGKLRVVSANGSLHRVGSRRYNDLAAIETAVRKVDLASVEEGDEEDDGATTARSGVSKKATGRSTKGGLTKRSEAAEEFDFLDFVARNDAEPDEMAALGKPGATPTMAAGGRAFGLEDLVLPSVDAHGQLHISTADGMSHAIPAELLGVQPGWRSPRSPRAAPASSPTAASARGAGGAGSNGPAVTFTGLGAVAPETPLLPALSPAKPTAKMDLYFRPVGEDDKMVVVIQSRPVDEWVTARAPTLNLPPGTGAGPASPSTGRASNQTPSDAEDAGAFDGPPRLEVPAAPWSPSAAGVSTRMSSSGPLAVSLASPVGASALHTGAGLPLVLSTSATSTAAAFAGSMLVHGAAGGAGLAGSPLQPAMSPTAASPEKVAMRHRLGGKAGVLARQLSGCIREDLPMRDFTVSPQASAMAREAAAAAAVASGTSPMASPARSRR